MQNIYRLPVITAILAILLSGCGVAQDRAPAVAGAFYPADPQQLKAQCEKYIDNADIPASDNKPKALIAPHAGYTYSGAVAGHAYAAIRGFQYDAVIILAPCHIEHFAFASVYQGDNYVTPLGKLPIDKKLAKRCCTPDQRVRLSDRGHIRNAMGRSEHSLEIQLPFLQTVVGKVPIVPIVVGTLDWQVIQTLGKQLADILAEEDVLLVASSDLSHYHDYQSCCKIDKRLIDRLQQLNPRHFYSGIASRDYEACGAGPITAVLLATQVAGADSIAILDYANSGDIPGANRSQVVGYLAAAIYNANTKGNKAMITNPFSEGDLTREEQLFIMDLAESTVEAVVRNQKPPVPKEIPTKMKTKRGAFVTLEKMGQLRGCIGYILPIYPLYETVMSVAESAALKDPRFPAVAPSELDDISVEVSVLTVPREISDPSIIEVGKHGIIIKKGYYQGLLLPQVATDYGWDRETFLEHTCLKAGLPRDAWKDTQTEIQIFSAQVFNRNTLKE